MSDFRSRYKSNPYVHTVDIFDSTPGAFSEIRNRQSINEDLESINELLHSAVNFDFIEARLGTCYVDRKTYKGDEQFAYSADEFNYSDDVNAVKFCVFSIDFINQFDVQIDNYEEFREEDFVATAHEAGVLLGYDYINIYEINEKINLIHYGVETVATVKGFLKPNSNYMHFNQEIFLDDKIILPFPEIIQNATDDTEKDYNFRLLLDKNNGIVSPKTTLAQAEQEIENISKSYNLPYQTSVSYKELQSEYSTIYIVLILSFCFCLFCLIIILLRLSKIMKSKRS